jgi:FixJ family two-component response regulator
MKSPPVPVPIGPPEGWRGTGTVLVIDDDDGVRDTAARMLEQAGLGVLVAGNGHDGLRVFREHQSGIVAVVLDLTMPVMGGLEVAGALRELRPDLPIVLMSGFSVEELTRQSTGLGITGFVEKPFTARDLLTAVRHALR